jgi:AraC-like DNA-binding protein
VPRAGHLGSVQLLIIAVHFKPGGGFPFAGVPAGELRNGSVALDLIWGRDSARVSDRLWQAETPGQRFRILERALLDRAQGRLNHHPDVRYALGVFDQSNGALPIQDVVQRIGISWRRFAELFRTEVGLSPKAFCRVRRFNEVLTRIERLAEVNWVDVALSCGYFDQSHFNHDFRAFSGLTPSDYLRDCISRTHVAIVE